jgi:hypothetical protein
MGVSGADRLAAAPHLPRTLHTHRPSAPRGAHPTTPALALLDHLAKAITTGSTSPIDAERRRSLAPKNPPPGLHVSGGSAELKKAGPAACQCSRPAHNSALATEQPTNIYPRGGWTCEVTGLLSIPGRPSSAARGVPTASPLWADLPDGRPPHIRRPMCASRRAAHASRPHARAALYPGRVLSEGF